MNTLPPILATDRECLEAWRRRPGAESLRPLVGRYGALVYSSAYRRTGSSGLAGEVTRAVFLVLVRRIHRVRKKTVLAGWLFLFTKVACRKLTGKPRRQWSGRKPKSELPADAPPWARIAPELDAVLERLSSTQREAVLLRVLLGDDAASVARILRTNERRVAKRVEGGLKKLARLLRSRGVVADAEALAQICSLESCAAPMPEGLAAVILASIDQGLGRSPTFPLARRTLFALAWARWRKVVIGVPCFFLLLVALAGTAWYVDSLTGHSRLLAAFLIWSSKMEAKNAPGLAQPARPWPAAASAPRGTPAGVRTVQEIYQTTNIWPVHLQFTSQQWEAMEPKRIAPSRLFQPDGTVLLRNPAASRSGLAGVLGFDFPWTSGRLEFGNVAFTNVAVRVKGNGTYLGSLFGDKRAYKVDLNKFVKGQKFNGADVFAFNNLINDQSYVSDALAYEFFRNAGVPASRTAYAYLNTGVEGRWERKPLGLYAMVEPVNADFALERFGSKQAPVFKPVTYELFKHLGDDWSAYEAIYDLKTQATAEQKRRVMEFARLVTFASEAEFARRLGEFLDLEKFARYLACEVLLSNYDSFLSDGQNFYFYLDPRSNKFGFIPWDLDLAWGGFFLLGTVQERERASIWHPWVGEHRLLERVMAVEEFRKIYRAQLEDLLARQFVPGRLSERIDQVAAAIRPSVAAESDFRLGKFERAVGKPRPELPSEAGRQGANRPAHQIKKFIQARAVSVREQLDGKSEGIILDRRRK